MAGPLTFEELLELWKSSTDDGYSRPLLENPNSGVEAIEQALVQHERASLMIDRTTQAMFILGWSGQTDEPASGGVHATVVLKFTRRLRFEELVVVAAGTVVEHWPDDYSSTGTIEVSTGRRYRTIADVRFLPGDQGPFEVVAVAEQVGHNYNLPLPDSIRRIAQAGVGLTNLYGSVFAVGAQSVLRLDEDPDVIGPQQVGQMVEFLSGSNRGRTRLIVGYEPPVPGVHGGDIRLDAWCVFDGTFVGTPLLGEVIRQGDARAFVVEVRATTLVVNNTGAVPFVPGMVTFESSSSTFTITEIIRDAWLVPELATAVWRISSWEEQAGLQVTNPTSPTGGRSAMLDELGDERGIGRVAGEADEQYRNRVAEIADTISPNAIRRSINDALEPWGVSGCLREIGSDQFFGFFYDAASSAAPDPGRSFAYDLDFDLNPLDRYKLLVSLIESRAFFLVTIPRLSLADFGFPYDAFTSGVNAYDMVEYALNFYDGLDVAIGEVYGAVWSAVDKVRAGGVGFDLVLDNLGC